MCVCVCVRVCVHAKCNQLYCKGTTVSGGKKQKGGKGKERGQSDLVSSQQHFIVFQTLCWCTTYDRGYGPPLTRHQFSKM